MRGQKFVIIFLVSLFTFKCNNVVIKNIKTNTVRVAKVDYLFEIGDTIFYENAKSEIIRKKLKDGTVIKKGPTIRVVEDKNVKTLNIPAPNVKK